MPITRTTRHVVASVAVAAGAAVALGAASRPAAAAAHTPKVTPPPSVHTQVAYDPEQNFTSKWTRADAMQIKAQSDPSVSPGQSSLPSDLTMPEIPKDFPTMVDQNGKQVWVWDTWPLTDAQGNQYDYNGWNVIFSLTADSNAGYSFDDRHVHAKIGYWYRKANDKNAQWTYGGLLFPKTGWPGTAQWSGSTRIEDGNNINVFYTALDFTDRNAPIATITNTKAHIHAGKDGVWFTGFDTFTPLLQPDGVLYQNVKQNPYYNFRDPFTFTDPAHPGKTYMVFEGNTASRREDYKCTPGDLGNSGEDPSSVTASGANFQLANVGLAEADNSDLTKWHFLPPILSANCVNDQTERPQFVIKKDHGQYKYYLFTISHASTYAAGLRGPDGVYGFVGNGIRSDFQPLNSGGLALGNPTDLNLAPLDPQQNGRAYQAYSHYVMPGGLVESFIDNVDGRRGGTLAPTVKLNIDGTSTSVDRSVGDNGLLGYGYIPSNMHRQGPWE